jgi:acyl transferase domain-containing protein
MSDFIERIQKLSPQRLALLAIELNSKLEALEGSLKDPIAVIGFGLRFPGGAHDAQSYWQILRDGVDVIQEIPSSRFDINALYDPDPEKPGKISTRWGGFVEPMDQFDPQFFGITPREATTMDPQQRMVLEVAWEALENAGYPPDQLTNSRTGVFLGACNNDYYHMLMQAGDQYADMYLSTGNAHSVISGRVSYLLGLQGPSLTIDTACSSSLVAIHQAYLSLKKGDCRMALAGGVNAILSPDTYIALSRAKMMAPDGRCKAFDASGDGFVRSEGCGLLVLKRLSAAQADGDQILAVILGSAINQDGRSNGLTAPNGPSQVAVIRAALVEAGLSPADVSYIETHGTGTSLGDPIEVQAIGEALGPGHSRDQALMIGSAKTNLGHLESAAGSAGIIKLILSLQHRQIPPHLHLKQLNPYIAWEKLPVTVPTSLTEWQAVNGRWIGGVSSFGFSGTNVHIILEAAPPAAVPANPIDRPLHLLTISARSKKSLAQQAARLAQYLAGNPASSLADLCFTQNTSRAAFSQRLALTANSQDKLQQQLADFADPEKSETGNPPAQVWSGTSPLRKPQVAFLFTGSGAQWSGMGKHLYETQPVFRNAFEKCDQLFRPYLPQPLLEVLYTQADGSSLLERFLYIQASTFSIEYALAQLWKSWGVVPDAVMGHSLGEYAAAIVSGVISLEDGVRLVAARGRLLESLPETGTMVAVFAPIQTVEKAISGLAKEISVAAVNGPQNIVISGRSNAIEQVVSRLEQDGIKTRRLAISQAAHSPLIDPVLAEFERVAAAVSYSEPQIDYISCLTGRLIQPDEITSAVYWRRHLREPVQFTAGIQALHANYQVFIEIGPNPVLIDMGQRCLPESSALWVSSLRKGKNDWEQILETLAAAWIHGVDVDWPGFDQPYQRRILPLPNTVFDRQRYWIAPDRRSGKKRPDSLDGSHQLLGKRIQSAAIADMVFETVISRDSLEFLEHHLIFGVVILPSPAFIEIALNAAKQVFGSGMHSIHNFNVQTALILPEEGERTVQIVIKPAQNQRAAFQILSFEEKTGNWTLHCTGEIEAQTGERSEPGGNPLDTTSIRSRCTAEISSVDYYAQLARLGLEFGSSFQGIEQIWRRDGEALGTIRLPQELESQDALYQFHPAFLDACFHLLGAALPEEGDEKAYLLIGIENFHLYRRPGRLLWNHTLLDHKNSKNKETFEANCWLYDVDGQLVAEIRGLQLKRAGRTALMRAINKRSDDWLYQVEWETKPLASGDKIPLLSPLKIAEALRDSAIRSESEADYAAYARLSPRLDTFCAAHILTALNTLGFQFIPGHSYTVDDLITTTGAQSRYRRLLHRYLEILAQEGMIRQAGSGWIAPQAETGSKPLETKEQLLEAFPAYQAEITLLARCAEALADVLRGKQDPLGLLFPGGSFLATESLYGQSPYARAFNALIREAIASCIPPHGKIRILEIGAGTGATTQIVLPILPADRAEYAFTDISQLFLEKARETFQSYPFVSYQLFDLEKDPASQGLPLHGYDIILAANILHATSDLRKSLAHIRQLLVPGGLAMILEDTRKESWVDLTFGLTEGWWRFTDTSLRPDYPTLSRSSWMALLADSGFAKVDSLPGPAIGSISGQELLIAQAPETANAVSEYIPQSWLILADSPAPEQASMGEALATALRARGDRCLLAVAGPSSSSPTSLGEDRWRIDPQDPAGYRLLLAETAQASSPPLNGIVHLWSFGKDEGTANEAMNFSAAILHLVQALKADTRKPQIWLATCGSQTVGSQNVQHALASAALWGLGRTLALEHPDLWGGLVDLDPQASTSANTLALLNELAAPDGEDQIAWRSTQRFTARLTRAGLPEPKSARLQPDKTYLVTGGLGGLGLKIANWLARQGARHLTLIGRKSLPPQETWGSLPPDHQQAGQVKAVQAIEALGAKVTTAPVDIANPAAVDNLFKRFGSELPPLGGIIHAAADLSNFKLDEMDLASLQTMFSPKIGGTQLLHQHSQNLDLDFFVLFSSTTALLGSQYLGHYAAANSYMDTFASFRQQQGLPAVSINWGTWDTMRAASREEQEQVTRFGLEQMASDQALDFLGDLMRGEMGAQVTVAAIDWEKLKAAYEVRRTIPFLARVENKRKRDLPQTQTVRRASGPNLPDQVRNAPPETRLNLLVAHIREQVAAVIGSSSPNSIDEHQGLFEMGMDSLMSVDLKTHLETSIGQSLPSTLTFNYPSVAELAGYLLERLIPSPTVVEQPPTLLQAPVEHPENAEIEMDDLSEDELAALLSKKLGAKP